MGDWDWGGDAAGMVVLPGGLGWNVRGHPAEKRAWEVWKGAGMRFPTPTMDVTPSLGIAV